MTTETQVSPGEETENPAPELANETPEVATPEVEAEQQPESQESEESKALKRMQRRIDKRTADLYRERAERERLARELESMRRQSPQDEDEAPGIRPDEIEARALEKAREIASRQALADKVSGVLKAGKALENFDAACNTVAEELPFYDDKGRPSDFLNAVLEFDDPAKLLHHLGTNPDLAAELADLSPTRRIRRLDAIEREMTERAKPKTSAAPKPLEPVKARATVSNDPSDSDSVEDWIAKERARMNRNRNV